MPPKQQFREKSQEKLQKLGEYKYNETTNTSNSAPLQVAEGVFKVEHKTKQTDDWSRYLSDDIELFLQPQEVTKGKKKEAKPAVSRFDVDSIDDGFFDSVPQKQQAKTSSGRNLIDLSQEIEDQQTKTAEFIRRFSQRETQKLELRAPPTPFVSKQTSNLRNYPNAYRRLSSQVQSISDIEKRISEVENILLTLQPGAKDINASNRYTYFTLLLEEQKAIKDALSVKNNDINGLLQSKAAEIDALAKSIQQKEALPNTPAQEIADDRNRLAQLKEKLEGERSSAEFVAFNSKFVEISDRVRRNTLEKLKKDPKAAQVLEIFTRFQGWQNVALIDYTLSILDGKSVIQSSNEKGLQNLQQLNEQQTLKIQSMDAKLKQLEDEKKLLEKRATDAEARIVNLEKADKTGDPATKQQLKQAQDRVKELESLNSLKDSQLEELKQFKDTFAALITNNTTQDVLVKELKLASDRFKASSKEELKSFGEVLEKAAENLEKNVSTNVDERVKELEKQKTELTKQKGEVQKRVDAFKNLLLQQGVTADQLLLIDDKIINPTEKKKLIQAAERMKLEAKKKSDELELLKKEKADLLADQMQKTTLIESLKLKLSEANKNAPKTVAVDAYKDKLLSILKTLTGNENYVLPASEEELLKEVDRITSQKTRGTVNDILKTLQADFIALRAETDPTRFANKIQEINDKVQKKLGTLSEQEKNQINSFVRQMTDLVSEGNKAKSDLAQYKSTSLTDDEARKKLVEERDKLLKSQQSLESALELQKDANAGLQKQLIEAEKTQKEVEKTLLLAQDKVKEFEQLKLDKEQVDETLKKLESKYEKTIQKQQVTDKYIKEVLRVDLKYNEATKQISLQETSGEIKRLRNEGLKELRSDMSKLYNNLDYNIQQLERVKADGKTEDIITMWKERATESQRAILNRFIGYMIQLWKAEDENSDMIKGWSEVNSSQNNDRRYFKRMQWLQQTLTGDQLGTATSLNDVVTKLEQLTQNPETITDYFKSFEDSTDAQGNVIHGWGTDASAFTVPKEDAGTGSPSYSLLGMKLRKKWNDRMKENGVGTNDDIWTGSGYDFIYETFTSLTKNGTVNGSLWSKYTK